MDINIHTHISGQTDRADCNITAFGLTVTVNLSPCNWAKDNWHSFETSNEANLWHWLLKFFNFLTLIQVDPWTGYYGKKRMHSEGLIKSSFMHTLITDDNAYHTFFMCVTYTYFACVHLFVLLPNATHWSNRASCFSQTCSCETSACLSWLETQQEAEISPIHQFYTERVFMSENKNATPRNPQTDSWQWDPVKLWRVNIG